MKLGAAAVERHGETLTAAAERYNFECVFCVIGHGQEGAKRIDDFNLEPGFIKIDVEGNEMKVLEGADKTIKKFKPKMMIECHDYLGIKLDDIISLVGEPTSIRNINHGIHHLYYFYNDYIRHVPLLMLFWSYFSLRC